ncbi:tyrosine-type recombinase/integrase [Micrococcaceae sp. AOP34-BR2-30]
MAADKSTHDTVVEAFCTWYAAHAAPTTVRNRRYYVARFLEWTQINEIPVWDATAQNLSEWLLTVGSSPSTRKNAASALERFYAWARLTNPSADNPAQLLPKIRVPRGVPKPTPTDLLTKALETAPRALDVLMLLLGSYGGLRAKEIAALHTHDAYDGSFRITGKGGHERYVPIHPIIAPVLSLFPTGFYFASKRNPTGHYLPGSITQRLGDLLGPGYSGHSLRHYFATAFYQEHRDILALRNLLGHANVQTTMVYTRINNDELRNQVADLPTTPGLNSIITRRRPVA